MNRGGRRSQKVQKKGEREIGMKKKKLKKQGNIDVNNSSKMRTKTKIWKALFP